jgi:hypothetical protein
MRVIHTHKPTKARRFQDFWTGTRLVLTPTPLSIEIKVFYTPSKLVDDFILITKHGAIILDDLFCCVITIFFVL